MSEVRSKVLSLNKKALESLKADKFKVCFDSLRRCEEILSRYMGQNVSDLWGLTTNNLGCYYKRIGKPLMALRFLKKALKLEAQAPAKQAGIHLNISSIRSKLGEHQVALNHSLEAIRLSSQPNVLVMGHYSAAQQYFALGDGFRAISCCNKALSVARTKGVCAEAVPLIEHLLQTAQNSKAQSSRPLSTTPVKIKRRHSPSQEDRFTKLTESTRFTTNSTKNKARLEELERTSKAFIERSLNIEKPRMFNGLYLFPMASSATPSGKKVKKDIYSVLKESPKRQTRPKPKSQFRNRPRKLSKSIQTTKMGRRKAAAIMIQKHWRGYQARKLFIPTHYDCKIKAAEESARKALEQLEVLRKAKEDLENKRFDKQRGSCPLPVRSKIQQAAPIRLGIRRKNKGDILEKYLKHLKAIVMIQANLRGYLARKKFFEMNSLTRSFVKKPKDLFKNIREAIVCIQKNIKDFRNN